MNDFGLTANEIAIIKNIILKYQNIEQVKIFGSRAKGNFTTSSDVDLVLFGSKITLNDILNLQNDLDDSSLIYLFDILHYDKITNTKLKDEIDTIKTNSNML